MKMRSLWIASLAAIFVLGYLGCSDDGAVCGNGVVEGDEVCDGDQWAGPVSCQTEGYAGGTIACSAICTADISGCYSAQCGNGVQETGEACDGNDLGSSTCQTEGFTGGDLSCTTSCSLDTTNCINDACPDVTLVSLDPYCTFDGTNWEFSDIVSVNSADYYVLWVELYPEYVSAGGGIVTGDHPLGVGDEHNYTDCAYCVSMTKCTDQNCTEADYDLFATSGTLRLDTLGVPGENLQGSLIDVGFEEWDFPPGNDVLVTDGECLDVASHTFDATVIDY